MSPELGRAALRIAMFAVVCSLGLLPFVDRSSAEFFITLLTLLLGLAFIGVVWLMLRFTRR